MSSLVFFAAISGLFINCGRDKGPVAGNVSGTPNTLTGTVLSTNGMLKAGIRVAIFSDNYVPYFNSGHAETTYTDNDGKFTFDSLSEGTKYNVFAWDTTENTGQYFSAIDIHSPITLKTLEFHGNIMGEIIRDSVFEGDTGLAYITGSPYYVVLDTHKTIMIKNIPPGQYCLSAAQKVNNDSGYQDSPESLPINPDTTIQLTILPKDTTPVVIDFCVMKRALCLADTSYTGIAKIVSIENTGGKDSCGEDVVEVRFNFIPNPPDSSPMDTAQIIYFGARAGKPSRSWVESLGVAVDKEYTCIKAVVRTKYNYYFILELYKVTWCVPAFYECP